MAIIFCGHFFLSYDPIHIRQFHILQVLQFRHTHPHSTSNNLYLLSISVRLWGNYFYISSVPNAYQKDTTIPIRLPAPIKKMIPVHLTNQTSMKNKTIVIYFPHVAFMPFLPPAPKKIPHTLPTQLLFKNKTISIRLSFPLHTHTHKSHTLYLPSFYLKTQPLPYVPLQLPLHPHKNPKHFTY